MLILNTAFMAAYQFGILICFADQIVRRVFPRLFAYMADYPEKWAVSYTPTSLLNLLTHILKESSWQASALWGCVHVHDV